MKIIRDIFISILFFTGFAVKAEEAHLYTWVDQDDVPFIIDFCFVSKCQ